jgi:hypothetical protein
MFMVVEPVTEPGLGPEPQRAAPAPAREGRDPRAQMRPKP